MTSFVFRVRNVPAALSTKPLGGFATNGVNMTKLESYHRGRRASRPPCSYAEIEGHPAGPSTCKLALEELAFFSSSLKILGVYPADPFRTEVTGAPARA